MGLTIPAPESIKGITSLEQAMNDQPVYHIACTREQRTAVLELLAVHGELSSRFPDGSINFRFDDPEALEDGLVELEDAFPDIEAKIV